MTFSTSEDFFFFRMKKIVFVLEFGKKKISCYKGGNNKLIFKMSFHFIFVLTWLFTLVGNFLIKYL